MGNVCFSANGAANGVNSRQEASQRASGSTGFTSRGGQSIVSVHTLPSHERERFLNRYDPVRRFGLNEESKLYRSTEAQFIKKIGNNDHLEAHPRSGTVIHDYEQVLPNPMLADHPGAITHVPVLKRASDLNVPSINVMFGPEAREGAEGYSHQGRRTTVEIRLGDFLQQGGRVYEDVSALSDDPYTSAPLVVTLPRGGSVPVINLGRPQGRE